jgi:replicative DNA helicase
VTQQNDGFVPEVEFALLGALLDGAGDLGPVLAHISPEQFVEPLHGYLFQAITIAAERFSSTDLRVVMRVLPQSVKDDFKKETGTDIGGFLSRMVTGTLHSSGGSLISIARNVAGQHARVMLAREARAIAEAAALPDNDPVQLLRESGAMVERLQSELRRGKRTKTTARFDEAYDSMIADAEAALDRGGPAGIPTGLVDVDRMTGGLHRRDLILLGARPSMGKTSIATSAALSAATAGHGVLIFSLEMDQSKLMTRMASDLAYRAGIRVAYQDIINNPTRQDIDNLRGAGQLYRTLPIWIDDTPSITVGDLRVKLEAKIAEAQAGGFTVDLVVVDHLLKMGSTSRYAGQRVLEIGEITGALKEIARDYDLAMLLLTQLSRAVENRDDKRPQLSDLRDSGTIEQDADVVLMLYREAYYIERQIASASTLDERMKLTRSLEECRQAGQLLVEKQRNGRVGHVDLFVDLPYSHFSAATRDGYAQMAERYRGVAA